MTNRALPKSPAKPDAITLLAALQPKASDAPVSAPLQSPPRRKSLLAKPGARSGTRQIAGHFPEETLRALKHVMAEEGTTLQALLDEAIDDLLVKKGRAKLRQL